LVAGKDAFGPLKSLAASFYLRVLSYWRQL
jgi:hypothetical protein